MTADDARSGSKDLVIIGSGGFARETAQAVQALNHGGAGWQLLGFLDDAAARHGQIVDGLPVLGGRDYLSQLPGTSLVVCTGRPDD
jgi:FlaA1/EpsC-like NDP-sugar epimerase